MRDLRPHLHLPAVMLAITLLAGCGRSLVDYRSPERGSAYHPPPAAFRTATHALGSRMPETLRTPEVRLAFATTRQAGGASFNDQADSAVNRGQVTMRLGPPGTTWDDLVDWARLNEEQLPPVRVELAALDRSDDRADDGFLAGLEPLYAHGGRRVLLYIPGDDASFAEAAATLACMHHHQGRRGAAVLFSWPASPRLTSAIEASSALARLITLLSGPGRTERLDCLVDTTGAEVLLGALRQLADPPGGERLAGLHLGSIVLTAPGSSVGKDLPLLATTTQRTVVYSTNTTLNQPHQDLTSAGERLEIIDVTGLTGGMAAGEAWYSDPMVVTDALVTLLTGLPAAGRGLMHGADGSTWILPPDYARTVGLLVRDHAGKMAE